MNEKRIAIISFLVIFMAVIASKFCGIKPATDKVEKDELLKSCPMCGSKDVVLVKNNENGCHVVCQGCSLSTGFSETEAEAICLWNSLKLDRSIIK